MGNTFMRKEGTSVEGDFPFASINKNNSEIHFI